MPTGQGVAAGLEEVVGQAVVVGQGVVASQGMVTDQRVLSARDRNVIGWSEIWLIRILFGRISVRRGRTPLKGIVQRKLTGVESGNNR